LQRLPFCRLQNGIIHNCTHGNNPDVRLTEDEMIVKIFSYLDKLFHIVKPQARRCHATHPAHSLRLVFLAVHSMRASNQQDKQSLVDCLQPAIAQ
jgi:hypothetical protein